jgi:hypothetical protein
VNWRHQLDHKISELLYEGLRLEGGEMVMPLKRIEIDSLAADIRDLVLESVREAQQ